MAVCECYRVHAAVRSCGCQCHGPADFCSVMGCGALCSRSTGMCPYHLLNQGYALEAKPFPSANVADKGALMKRDPLEPMTRIQPMTTQSVPPLMV